MTCKWKIVIILWLALFLHFLQTDLGSPLMCLSESGIWQLHGVLSHRGECSPQNPSGRRSAVFTDIMDTKEWIYKTIGNILDTLSFHFMWIDFPCPSVSFHKLWKLLKILFQVLILTRANKVVLMTGTDREQPTVA